MNDYIIAMCMKYGTHIYYDLVKEYGNSNEMLAMKYGTGNVRN